MASPNDFNAQVIEEFRANEGRVGGMFEGMPVVLVHHTGAKSGTARVNPLVYLKANPRTEIEVGTEKMAVTASEAKGEERDRLFEEQKRLQPQFADYETKTGGRVIPVVVLTPVA